MINYVKNDLIGAILMLLNCWIERNLLLKWKYEDIIQYKTSNQCEIFNSWYICFIQRFSTKSKMTSQRIGRFTAPFLWDRLVSTGVLVGVFNTPSRVYLYIRNTDAAIKLRYPGHYLVIARPARPHWENKMQ